MFHYKRKSMLNSFSFPIHFCAPPTYLYSFRIPRNIRKAIFASSSSQASSISAQHDRSGLWTLLINFPPDFTILWEIRALIAVAAQLAAM